MSSPLPSFLVNQTRWSDVLKNLAVTKGLDHVELLAQLSAAIVLENDRPEHKYLAGEALAWGQYQLAAIAAVVGYVGLRNPIGSGKLIVVEGVRGLPGASSTISRMYVGLARAETATSQSTEQPRDTRWQPSGAFGVGAPNIVGQIVSARGDTITVAPFVVAEYIAGFTSAVAQQGREQPALVLAPGDTVYTWLSSGAGGTVVNTAVQASFWWRERTLEPTET